MIGILVILAASWLLLYLTTKQDIRALGFLPLTKRLKQFVIGFLFTGFLCLMAQYAEAWLRSSDWVVSKTTGSTVILKSLWWDVRSVITEELIFRGALLYIIIQKLGARTGIWLSAAAFGVYHWFSFGVLGHFPAMVVVFIGTGLMGYAWALAFVKTRSIILPFGLHLGWNFVYNTIFSKGPLGTLVLVSQEGHDLDGWPWLLNFLLGLVIVPVATITFVNWGVKQKMVA